MSFVIQKLSVRTFSNVNRVAFIRAARPFLTQIKYQTTFKNASRELGAGLVRVQMRASFVCSEDLRISVGISLNHKHSKPGTSGVGVIDSVGTGVATSLKGESVLVIDQPNCWGGNIDVEEKHLIKLPKLFPIERAALLPEFLTAWALLNDGVVLKRGDTVLHSMGADSPVGIALKVLGSEMHLNILHDWASARGAALAVSGTSGKVCTDLVRRLNKGGTLVVLPGPPESASASGEVGVPVAASIFSGASVQGFELGAWLRAHPELARRGVDELIAIIGENKFDPPTTLFSFKDYEQALLFARSGQSALLVSS